MKPAPFTYHAPSLVGEAIDLLDELGDDARPLAGGQSLVPMMNLRLARPAALVDLNGIRELEYHRVEPDALVVGALSRHRDVELDSVAMSRCAAIADAVPQIGHVAIRNRGTVVGSLVHADPSAEWPCLALLLDAQIRVRGRDGERTIPADQFFRGVFTTALQAGELVVEARFGWPPAGSGSAFVELARRHGDFALAGAAAVVALSPDGSAREVRVAVAGLDAVPLRAAAAEAALAGRVPGPQACHDAAAAAASSLDPPDDIHAPAAYRRRLGQTLIRRALEAAVARAASFEEQ
jgi:carbon-monoxide dehydrogenase medium subunit